MSKIISNTKAALATLFASKGSMTIDQIAETNGFDGDDSEDLIWVLDSLKDLVVKGPDGYAFVPKDRNMMEEELSIELAAFSGYESVFQIVKSMMIVLYRTGEAMDTESFVDALDLGEDEVESALDVLDRFPRVVSCESGAYKFIGNPAELTMINFEIEGLMMDTIQLGQAAFDLSKAGVRVPASEEDLNVIDARIMKQISARGQYSKSGLGRLLTRKAELGFVGRTFIMDRVDAVHERGLLKAERLNDTSNRMIYKATEAGLDFLNKHKGLLEDIVY